MLTDTDKNIRIQRFMEELKELSWFRPEEPGKTLYHMGAVVARTDDEARELARIIAKQLSANTATLSKDSDIVENEMVSANAAGQSMVILLEGDLPFTALQILKQIAEFNDFAPYMADKRIKQDQNTRVVAIFSHEIWGKQSYPSFIDLFGIICRLDIDNYGII